MVTTLYNLSQKSKEKSHLCWLFNSIIDAVRAGVCEAAVLTNSVLDGSKGKKGLGDLFIYKMGMRDYLLATFISQ
eukprot:1023268-Pyramimonas_sp.AAC.1